MKAYTIPLQKKCSVGLCGGKAFQLSRLMNNNFPVPGGYSVTSLAFDKFCSHNNLNSMIDQAALALKSGTVPLALLENIRAGIQKGIFPAEIMAEVGSWQTRMPAGVLAVRSSAISEDGFQQSFAGLLETCLRVSNTPEDVLNAIKSVWSSLFGERVFQYLLQRPPEDNVFTMGVLVQEMIQAQVAGVAFSIHPSKNDPEQIYIEETDSSGEALVTGDITPAIHTIFREKMSGTNDRLSFREELAWRVLQLEDLLYHPVDVEWAYDGKQLWILQVRPVTGIKLDDITIWTDENVGEVLPAVVTPMTWSVLGPMTNKSFLWILKRLGSHVPWRAALFGKIDGKAYFNHSLFGKAVTWFFPSGYRKQEQLRRNFFGAVRILGHSLNIASRFVLMSIWLPFRSKTISSVGPPATAEISDDPLVLLDNIDAIVKNERKLMRLHVANTFIGEIFFQIFRGVLSKISDSNVKDSPEKLVSDIGEAASVGSGLALKNMAARMQGVMQKENLSSSNAASFVSLVKTNGTLNELYKDFLKKYGFMSDQEFELAYPRWEEESDQLLIVIFNLLYRSPKGDDQETESVPDSNSNGQLLTFHKSLILNRLIHYLMGRVKTFNRNRENLKQQFIRIHFALKKNLLAAAVHLKDAQVLLDVDDIYFLNISELRLLLVNTSCGQEEFWTKRMHARRQLHEDYVKMPHPYRMIEYGGRLQSAHVSQNPAAGTLSGIPCSTGFIQGSARVLHTFEESAALKPGEILVTHSANPGWTPLFILAKGVVTEIGGALSHSAIIAREYGIPMVASVTDAISQIGTGDFISVDGTSGLIQILKKQA